MNPDDTSRIPRTTAVPTAHAPLRRKLWRRLEAHSPSFQNPRRDGALLRETRDFPPSAEAAASYSPTGEYDAANNDRRPFGHGRRTTVDTYACSDPDPREVLV